MQNKHLIAQITAKHLLNRLECKQTAIMGIFKAHNPIV